MTNTSSSYTEDNIRTLDWREHIRMRPGMYIGKTGDGQSFDDGIYILIKEILDNAIDEYVMGNGNTVEIEVDDYDVRVRDYGRGIPLGKVVECVSKINTGGKYDSKAFKKSVGLNGVGTKAVNALSETFTVRSFRDKQTKEACFAGGLLKEDKEVKSIRKPDGTEIIFRPDNEIFKGFRFQTQHLREMLWNYAYLNAGLTLKLNGEAFYSENGLADLLARKVSEDGRRYPIIHLKGEDIEVAFTHGEQYGEEYYSFVNGQNTTQGGTHLQAFREALAKTVREHFKKEFNAADIHTSAVGAVSVRVENPVFESQTKTKLGSTHMSPDGPTVRSFMADFLKNQLDNFLHQHPKVAEAMLKRIQQSEKERKDMAGIRKLANERAKKANLHNRKLRDCKVHLTDTKNERREESTVFITEGDSASGSITKARDVQTQAVFSLRGKPLNSFGMKKKIVYENEEFNLLQHALDIEDSLDNLRYNRIVLATDADVDGMHIRLLLMTFFLQFFPELVRRGHVYILETPLFRVRNKKTTRYCYNDSERAAAVRDLGGKPEITRFKGLGEISPDEFKRFIQQDLRLDQVRLDQEQSVRQLLTYYMGKNTQDRQRFIIDNLKIEKDLEEELLG